MIVEAHHREPWPGRVVSSGNDT
ncbi:MAG: hypothetical protein QOE74_429, partial [Mycobacterium sp.]|nr:hypothetical protein [Mycobacterium sp.]